MVSRSNILYLLAFPIGLMGFVQSLFAAISFFIFQDRESSVFLETSTSLLAIALILILLTKQHKPAKIRYKDSLLFAVLTWTIIGLTGAIPIKLISQVSFTDAVFESVSAVTTTGATILSGLDGMPKTFLLYRQFLQWLGGLGIVVFVVAILPMLNVGGMRLLKAETPGPMKDDKLSPRIANTAHYLWLVYISLTLLCAVAYFIAGMSAFDAIAHSLTTISTGGFSTHDASMGYFQSSTILLISDFFMVAGAISFALHFRVWRARKGWLYWNDEETRIFVYLVAAITIAVAGMLASKGFYSGFFSALNDALFVVISFITSTGYGTAGYSDWPVAIAFILICTGYLGGCAGSTAGGNKIIRNILTVKVIGIELKRLIHTRGAFAIKYQTRPVEASVISATMSFMFFAALSSMVLTLLLVSTGLDFWSSFSAVASCLNVSGPGFGVLGNNFQPVTDFGTWVLSGSMILGRLEYFTVLALFSPLFWQR